MRRRPPISPLSPHTTLCARGRHPPHRPGPPAARAVAVAEALGGDRKSTRLNSSHTVISYAVFCLKKKEGGGNLADRMRRGNYGSSVLSRSSAHQAVVPRRRGYVALVTSSVLCWFCFFF